MGYGSFWIRVYPSNQSVALVLKIELTATPKTQKLTR